MLLSTAVPMKVTDQNPCCSNWTPTERAA